MTTQPIAPDTLLDDLHPSRFLKVADLLERWHVQQITVTISRMVSEETIPNPKDLDPATKKPNVVMQPVLYFLTRASTESLKNFLKESQVDTTQQTKDFLARAGTEFPRGYLLASKTDTESLKTATGARTAGELTGKKITIKVSEHKGKAVLRIAPTAPKE